MSAQRISYIVTTACGDPHVANQFGGAGITSRSMTARAELLREEILPTALPQGFDEIIVCGRYPDDMPDEFPDVIWIKLPPLRRDRIEAQRQREVGSRLSTGDILVMGSDDHMVGQHFGETLREIADEEWDILTPQRIHAVTGEILNNGAETGKEWLRPYSPWHLNVVRRWVWATVPWTKLDVTGPDNILSDTYESVGARMVWDDRLQAIDVEAAEGEA